MTPAELKLADAVGQLVPDWQPDIDPVRHRVRVGDDWRPLSPRQWQVFDALHRRRGPVRATALVTRGCCESLVREQISKLRGRLDGSVFEIVTHRQIASYELLVR
jgi:hypothetical protein